MNNLPQPLSWVAVTAIMISMGASAQTVVTPVPGPSIFDDAITVAADGTRYISYFNGNLVARVTGVDQVDTLATGFNGPGSLTIGPDGNIYVPNAYGNTIHRVTPDGDVTVFAPSVPNPNAAMFTLGGELLCTSYSTNRIYAIDGDGNWTIRWQGAPMNGPIALEHDEAGNIYVGNYNDGRVFRIAPDSTFTQLADLPGNLGNMEYCNGYLYATGLTAHRIYRISVGGGMDVFAGTGSVGGADGPWHAATFNGPNGIAATPVGDALYVTDFNARRLRVITAIADWVGLEEVEKKAPLGLWPVPSQDRITIALPEGDDRIEQLFVVDAAARAWPLAFTRSMDGMVTVPVDHLAAGMHVVQVRTGRGRVLQASFVKQ